MVIDDKLPIRRLPRRAGFSLIELIVVTIIVGILASIVAPTMQGLTKKAMLTEAVSGLGTIRTALRLCRVERGYYPVHSYGFFDPVRSHEILDNYLKYSDLDGTYFSASCYGIQVRSQTEIEIRCVVSKNYNSAPKADAAATLADPGASWPSIIMDGDGNLKQEDVSCSGYPPYYN